MSERLTKMVNQKGVTCTVCTRAILCPTLVPLIDQMRKAAAQEDYLRTLGVRLWHNPNAMVLDHPEEFVRRVVEAIADKART